MAKESLCSTGRCARPRFNKAGRELLGIPREEMIVGNAVKYGAPRRLVTVTVLEDNDSVVLIVHTEGSPLSLEEKNNLFQLFKRGPSSFGTEKIGWGIGLTLVQGVAEAHGGVVELSSDETSGTNFIVRLPRDARPFQVASAKAAG